MKKLLRLPILIAAVSICLILGCGNSEGPKLVPAGGTVTLDGAPLTDAEIIFHPEGEAGMSASAVSDSDGNYEVKTLGNDGIVAGNYKVTVRKFQVDDPMFAGDPAETGMDPMQLEAAAAVPGEVKDVDLGQFIPPQFSDPEKTTLTVSVPESGNENLNIAVTSE